MSAARRSNRSRSGNRNQGRGRGNKGGNRSGQQNNQPSRDFWGRPGEEPALEPLRPAPRPTAVIGSLGDPPLRGHEPVAEHYFEAVYGRSANLASALAAASGLLDLEALTDSDGPV